MKLKLYPKGKGYIYSDGYAVMDGKDVGMIFADVKGVKCYGRAYPLDYLQTTDDAKKIKGGFEIDVLDKYVYKKCTPISYDYGILHDEYYINTRYIRVLEPTAYNTIYDVNVQVSFKEVTVEMRRLDKKQYLLDKTEYIDDINRDKPILSYPIGKKENGTDISINIYAPNEQMATTVRRFLNIYYSTFYARRDENLRKYTGRQSVIYSLNDAKVLSLSKPLVSTGSIFINENEKLKEIDINHTETLIYYLYKRGYELPNIKIEEQDNMVYIYGKEMSGVVENINDTNKRYSYRTSHIARLPIVDKRFVDDELNAGLDKIKRELEEN